MIVFIFKVMGRVQSKGNNNSVVNYEMVDNDKFEGIRYYKLRQVDFDGNEKFYGPKVLFRKF
jgi:hypothetical protein